MDKNVLIEMGIESTIADKIVELAKEDLKGYIPKDRFDEVNEAKKKLEEDVTTRDSQLEELKKVAGDNTDYQAKISELQKANADAKKQYEQDIYNLKLDTAIEKALIEGKARNVKMVKSMLDMATIKLDGESLTGFDEQLKGLKSNPDTAFAFVAEGEPETNMKGEFKPGDNGGSPGKAQPKTYADFCKLYPQK